MTFTYIKPNSQDLKKVTKVKVISSNNFWHFWTNGTGIYEVGFEWLKHSKTFSVYLGYRIVSISFRHTFSSTVKLDKAKSRIMPKTKMLQK